MEALAQRVVELIRNEGGSRVGRSFVDAATLASELGVERSWVYAHRDELGPFSSGLVQSRACGSMWLRPERRSCAPTTRRGRQRHPVL
jgi:hypothetical protein